MSSSQQQNEEKKRLANERQNAVRKAWKQERERVQEGKGTRKWTLEQQKEILDRGSVRGYEGHHMKSVSLYPEYAGEPKNIQFLTEDEHLYGAHKGNYHNLTNGYYDADNQTMVEFNGNEIRDIPEVDLQNQEDDELNTVLNNEYDDTKTQETVINNSQDRAISKSNNHEVSR